MFDFTRHVSTRRGDASNGFSIAGRNDAGMLDVAGFDAATPQVITDFTSDRRS